MPTIPVTGAPGFRFFKDLYPAERQGGISYYPYSSIYSGLVATITLPGAAAPAAAPANITAGVTAGEAYLDGELARSASAVTLTIDPDRDGSVMYGENNYRIYLNPVRRLQPVAMGGAAPTTLTNGVAISAGDMYATCVDSGDYFVAQDFYKYSGTAWAKFDPSFAAPDVPAQPGKSRVWGNAMSSTLVPANFTVNSVEKRIYVGGSVAPYTYRASLALLRDSASLEIATAKLFYFVLPLPVEATFTNGSTSVVVSSAFSTTVAELVAALSATTTIAIDGAALAASGYNSGTSTITLAAAYTGTSGTKTVNITPVTAGNNVVLAPAKSSISSSLNLTNP